MGCAGSPASANAYRKSYERDRPDVIVSVYPPYPHLLDELCGPANGSKPRRIVCVTDSITINSIWYRCSTDYFLLANDQTADVLARAGIDRALMRVFGFPVSPRFAERRRAANSAIRSALADFADDKRRPKFRLQP